MLATRKWVPMLLAVAACDSESPTQPALLDTENTVFSQQVMTGREWSEPVNLGPVVNSPFLEESPALSRDGLTLYFMSSRPGGVGGNDLWASRRDCHDCPWQAPVNLAAINSVRNENGPAFTRDGQSLYFQSNRVGSQLLDIYVATRSDPSDDQGWLPAVRLGPETNSALRDIYARPLEGGPGTRLFFARGATTHDAELFLVTLREDGTADGPAEALADLNDPDPAVDESGPAVRADGHEIVFRSNRTGSLGAGDLWVSTRHGGGWTAPVPLEAPLNTIHDEVTPAFSFDGRTLLFVSNRPGGEGDFDIWMSRRNGNPEPARQPD